MTRQAQGVTTLAVQVRRRHVDHHSRRHCRQGGRISALTDQGLSVGGGCLAAEAELNKLKEDLMVVRERVKLCREMLPNSPGVREDEALAEVVGFLEACKPRMVSDSHTSSSSGSGLQHGWITGSRTRSAVRANY